MSDRLLAGLLALAQLVPVQFVELDRLVVALGVGQHLQADHLLAVAASAGPGIRTSIRHRICSFIVPSWTA